MQNCVKFYILGHHCLISGRDGAIAHSSVRRAKVPPLPGRHVDMSASIENVKCPPRLPYFNVHGAILQRTVVDRTGTNCFGSWSPYAMQTKRRRINPNSEDQMTTLVVTRSRKTSKLIGSQDCPIRVVAGVITGDSFSRLAAVSVSHTKRHLITSAAFASHVTGFSPITNHNHTNHLTTVFGGVSSCNHRLDNV